MRLLEQLSRDKGSGRTPVHGRNLTGRRLFPLGNRRRLPSGAPDLGCLERLHAGDHFDVGAIDMGTGQPVPGGEDNGTIRERTTRNALGDLTLGLRQHPPSPALARPARAASFRADSTAADYSGGMGLHSLRSRSVSSWRLTSALSVRDCAGFRGG